mmetsp:Transcript_5240/g.11588  ORF Transcript_5240/g.11588 Transcript_5240/m.11588 type:complete len:212 (-) Transcript_5240:73-708(-)
MCRRMPKHRTSIHVVLELQKLHLAHTPHQRTSHIPKHCQLRLILISIINFQLGHRLSKGVNTAHTVFFGVVVGYVGGVGDASNGGVVSKAPSDGGGHVEGGGAPGLVLDSFLVLTQHLAIRQRHLNIHRHLLRQLLIPPLLHSIIHIRSHFNPARVHTTLRETITADEIGGCIIHTWTGGGFGSTALEAFFGFVIGFGLRFDEGGSDCWVE